MNLSTHVPSLSDPTWIEKNIDIMGEIPFWEYVNNVYTSLEKMEVGKSFPVERWVKPENFDLFIKVATCFISTSKCCYQFNTEHNIIKRNFNENTMENALAVLARQRKLQIAGTDGEGTEGSGKGPETVHAPNSPV